MGQPAPGTHSHPLHQPCARTAPESAPTRTPSLPWACALIAQLSLVFDTMCLCTHSWAIPGPAPASKWGTLGTTGPISAGDVPWLKRALARTCLGSNPTPPLPSTLELAARGTEAMPAVQPAMRTHVMRVQCVRCATCDVRNLPTGGQILAQRGHAGRGGAHQHRRYPHAAAGGAACQHAVRRVHPGGAAACAVRVVCVVAGGAARQHAARCVHPGGAAVCAVRVVCVVAGGAARQHAVRCVHPGGAAACAVRVVCVVAGGAARQHAVRRVHPGGLLRVLCALCVWWLVEQHASMLYAVCTQVGCCVCCARCVCGGPVEQHASIMITLSAPEGGTPLLHPALLHPAGLGWTWLGGAGLCQNRLGWNGMGWMGRAVPGHATHAPLACPPHAIAHPRHTPPPCCRRAM